MARATHHTSVALRTAHGGRDALRRRSFPAVSLHALKRTRELGGVGRRRCGRWAAVQHARGQIHMRVYQHPQPRSQLLVHHLTATSPSTPVLGVASWDEAHTIRVRRDRTPASYVSLARRGVAVRHPANWMRLLVAALLLCMCTAPDVVVAATSSSARRRSSRPSRALDATRSRLGRLFSSNAATTPPRASPAPLLTLRSGTVYGSASPLRWWCCMRPEGWLGRDPRY